MNKLLFYLALTAHDLNLEYMQAPATEKIANLIGPNNRYTGSEGCRDLNKRHVVFPHPFNFSITDFW